MELKRGMWRGKDVDTKEWVVGWKISDPDGKAWIVKTLSYGAHTWERVDPSTLGEYTGLPDRHGDMMCEHDILLWGDQEAIKAGTARYVEVQYRSGCFGIWDGKVFHEFWHYGPGSWDDEPITADMWGELPIEKYIRACFQIIGPKLDNPDLLGGTE